MTVQTEMPILLEHKVHRVYHQHHHHHHYHLHHALDHHHLHIHNQSIYRRHISADSNHLQSLNHNHHEPVGPQLQNGRSSEQATLAIHVQATAAIQETRSIVQQQQLQLPHQPINHSIQTPQQQQLFDPVQSASNGHELLQASGLAHLIARHNQREQRILAASHVQQNRPSSSLVRSKQRSQIQFFLLSAFAYLLSPIDLIPEAIFGIFGILDDLVFLFMCLFCVAIILLYPLFREVRRTMFDKLGFKQKQAIAGNKET